MTNYKKELNAEQYKVVTDGDGPCLVLAGAGSGKTRAITYRVAYLLERGINPKNILLVTFTNKAAAEMINRVKDLLGGQINLPWSGTYHHIGYRILRQYASLIGYKSNFTILDAQDSLDLIKLCTKLEGLDKKERRYPSAKVIQSIISFSRNAERSVADVLNEKYPNWLDISDKISSVASEYAKRKVGANAMDFDDLLVNTYLLLCKSISVQKKLSEQFQYVLVDEYQDTNKIQASIIKSLAMYHKNILVVGDDAQSIYSFRAADIENILKFERDYPDAKIFKLETNYRSTPDILRVANVVIENNVNQYQKDLKSILDNFVKPEAHAFADSQEEASFIVDRLLELNEEGVELNKMAVLFRAAYHSQALEVELTRRDIPYEFRGGVRFFERSHIKDVLAYLRIYNNPQDEIAWSRVLNMQVGIGPAFASGIIKAIKNQPPSSSPLQGGSETVFTNLTMNLSARAKVGWGDFLQNWEAMDREVVKEPSALIQAVIQSKYKEYLEQEYPDARERMQDLEQLAMFADKQKDIDRFLAEASLQENYTQQERSPAEMLGKEKGDKLILSTIHQAKGLEWEVVFVIGLNNGQFPSDRSMKEKNGVEEERRLFYVAITRAKKYLYFTYSLSGGFGSYMKGNTYPNFTSGQGPSMFLDEIGTSLVEGNTFKAGTVFDEGDDEVVYIVDDEPFTDKPRTSFLSDVGDL
ncbi:MAG: ATP-dependent helicase [bacterium]|nr:ATP-dependent helicase [bacterium]